MTENSDKPTVKSLSVPQNQRERWIQQGSNVAVQTLVVAALVIAITYVVSVHTLGRIDTTIGGAQSLRPQTVEFVKDLKTKVRIVALYPKVKTDSKEPDYYQPVADLLGEYAAKSPNISIELLDPSTQRDEFGKLVSDVTNTYGGEVKAYKAILDGLPATENDIGQFAANEQGILEKLAPVIQQVTDQNFAEVLPALAPTIESMQEELKQMEADVDADTTQSVPAYKDATADVAGDLGDIAGKAMTIAAVLKEALSSPGVPAEFKVYIPGAIDRMTAAAKNISTVTDAIEHLPPLTELSEFRNELKSKSIIVMATPTTGIEGGYKILHFDELWKTPEMNRAVQTSEEAPRMTFAGEPAIDSAIASLTSGKKPMVVFVGPNVDQAVSQSFTAMASRLREYNFDVQTKDTSPDAQPPEQGALTEAQLRDAIWVVLGVPDNPMMGGGSTEAMLKNHLDEGGSAMVMVMASAGSMSSALTPLGVQAQTNYMVVREALPAPPRMPTDPVQGFLLTNQTGFLLNRYGDHPLVAPLQGLGLLLLYAAPVSLTSPLPAGVTGTPLLPFPTIPHSWAANDAQTVIQNSESRAPVMYNPSSDSRDGRLGPDKDNTPATPLYGAAAVEKGTQRVVVVGALSFATDGLVNLGDTDRPDVRRLPGNGEFFMDSIFWLAHMDKMLSVSPHALDVSRIVEMSPAAANFWRLGVLIIGLPLAVVVCGLMVYVRRRD